MRMATNMLAPSKMMSKRGKVRYIYANGNKYSGAFEADDKNGRGTYTYVNGDKYVGTFKGAKDRSRHISYANGDKYDGASIRA